MDRNFEHIKSLHRRVLKNQIDERLATTERKRLEARAGWIINLTDLKLECIMKGIDFDLLSLDALLEPQKRELTLGSVQTESDTPTCPVCDVELPKGKKYCSNEHRYQFHNQKKRKND